MSEVWGLRSGVVDIVIARAGCQSITNGEGADMTHILYVVSTIVGAFSMAKELTWRHFCVLGVRHVNTFAIGNALTPCLSTPTRSWIMGSELLAPKWSNYLNF